MKIRLEGVERRYYTCPKIGAVLVLVFASGWVIGFAWGGGF